MNINRPELAAALTRAAQFTATLDDHPLARIRLENSDGMLSVMASNLSATVEIMVPASGRDRLKPPVLVPTTIAKQVAALAADEVELAVDAKAGRMTIKGGATFRLPVTDAAEFPTIEVPTDGHLDVDADWARRFEAVASHASRDQARPLLACVRIGDGVMQASDSYRLGVVDQPLDTVLNVPVGHKLAPVVDSIDWDHRQVMFTSAEGRMWLRQVDGITRDLRTAIPTGKPSGVATVDAQTLAAALTRAQLVGKTDTNGVDISHHDDGMLRVSSVPGDVEFEELVEADMPDIGTPARLRPQYVVAALAPIKGDATITFAANPSTQPITVSADWWSSTVMPLRVS